VVLNRVGCADCEITLKKAEETIGMAAFWQVPNDTRSMLGSRNNGVPLLEFAPKSKLHQNIKDLGDALIGKKEAAPKKERRGFFSFR
jgi:pilus assembly protein CpaE